MGDGRASPAGGWPGPGEVVVEWALLDELPDAADELTAEERARRDRMRPAVGMRWARGRAFVRRRLAARLDIPATEVDLRAEARGRPYLGMVPTGEAAGVGFVVPVEPLDLSISHSATVIALAVASCRVGVDVDDSPGQPDLLRIAAVVATTEELAELANVARADPALLAPTFLRWWVRKEAVLKAQGSGFLDDPTAVSVGVLAPAPPAPWTLVDLGPLPGGSALAVAFADRAGAVRVQRCS